MAASSIDPNDIQGLVRFGYSRLSEACYLLLRIRDAGAARAWCEIAPVATAEFKEQPPDVALQVAFTAQGLQNLGLKPEVCSQFSSEFQGGMAGDQNRSRRLGDTGVNAPEEWSWGGVHKVPDVLVILCALPGKLAEWRASLEDSLWEAAFELVLCLGTSDLKGREPFGFVDSISQPQIDWSGMPSGSNGQISYSNVPASGEFLLGYPNEYGKYTDRPLLNSSDAGAADLLPAEDVPGKKDVGRNGTFLVMRTLEQDVRAFWSFLDLQTSSNSGARQKLAEKMVGRTMQGGPLVPVSADAIPGIPSDAAHDSNRFTFDQDAGGMRCPFGAHIRRANPRNTDYPNQPSWLLPLLWAKLGFASKGMDTDIMASARFHRILRRGREYGSLLTPQEAIEEGPADQTKRGIHFICLNANIGRQFEFVQNAWLMSTKFDGLTDETDPLLGNRAPLSDGRPTDNFTIPRERGLASTVTGLPQFITVRGGAYFFLPSIRTLRYFSRMAAY